MTDSASAPTITVCENGPYIVSSNLPIKRRTRVLSEHGEPMTWQTTEHLEPAGEPGAGVALCRCGGSSNKPYCDGSHQTNGFDGTETAATTTYSARARTFEGTGVVVRDDRSICEHAGFCGNRATTVWKMLKGDDTADSIARAQLMAMIERCPSGALTYRMTPDGQDVEPDIATGIAVTDDGPLFVTGSVRIERADGEELEPRPRVTLCRCGASGNKPLCDGSHAKIGFQDS